MSLFCKYDVGSLEIKINDHPLEIDALSHETDFLKTDSLPSEACGGQSCLSKITALQVQEVACRNHCFLKDINLTMSSIDLPLGLLHIYDILKSGS